MTLDELRSIAPLAEKKTVDHAVRTYASSVSSLPSFAKINLDLRILGTRPDGYHDLRTVFQSLALFDNVTVTARRGPLAVTCDEPDIPTDQRNLVWKAASLLHRVATGKSSAPRDIAIDLRKRVPSEAGLGGGSSNAAMTLLALNKLWKLDLDLATLTRIGARLGADVPYFLVGGTALGLGRGDDIYPLADLPPVHVVILRPGFGVATSDAYQWFDEESRRAAKEPAPRADSAGLAGLVGHAPERSRSARWCGTTRQSAGSASRCSMPGRRLRPCRARDRRYSACSSAPTRRAELRTTWRGPAGCRSTPAP